MWWIGLGVLMKNSLAADPWMAPSMAAGGVTRANPTSMGAILTSPATLALTPRYEIALGGRLGSSKVRRVEAAATDSSTGPLTLGLMYLREGASFEATPDELPGWLTPDQDTINPYTESTVGGGLAMSWLNRHLSAGIGGRFTRYASRFAEQSDTYAFNASVAGQIDEQVFIALTGENLYSTDSSDALKVGTGLRWQPPRRDNSGTSALGIETDLVAVLGEEAMLSDIHLGLEVRPSPFVPIRMGLHRDQLSGSDAVTAGLGAGTEEAMFEYAARLQTSTWAHSHSLSLRFFL